MMSFAAPPRSSRKSGSNKDGNNVRVVVRIRPMNAEEERKQCQVALQPLQQQQQQIHEEPEILESPSGKSLESVDTQGSSFSLLAALSLKLRRKKKKTATTNGSSSSSSAHQKNYYPNIVTANKQRQFEFHAVYGTHVNQNEIYDHSIGDSITSNIFEGYNTTILAYGMTGSGKTHTMSGRNGVIDQAVRDIFRGKDDKQKVIVQLTCMEIYSDEAYDLLVEEKVSVPLKLRDSGEDVTISGLQRIAVENEQEVHELLGFASLRRTTSCTYLNERSSRSHAIYTLFVTTEETMSKLTLVDLAGSERIKQSGVEGTQRRESININSDLFVLGKVVNALSTGMPHVPYRDSKLTRLLRDSLGGNCRTVLIACISPADLHLDESINTLRYAERTQCITNLAKQNVLENAGADYEALRAENKVLKARIANLSRQCREQKDPTLSGRGMEFPTLEAKLRLAQEQSRATRESVNLVAATADRLKHRHAKMAELNAASNENDKVRSVASLLQENVIICDELFGLCEKFGMQTPGHVERQDEISLKERVRSMALSLKTCDGKLHTALIELLGEDAQRLEQQQMTMKELEDRCLALSDDVDFVNHENDILRGHNKKLLSELEKLRTNAESTESTLAMDDSEGESSSKQSSFQPEVATRVEHNGWLEQEGGLGVDDSINSSFATDLLPSSHENQVFIGDMENIGSGSVCPCQGSAFSTQPEHVEFYLPMLRIICHCGKNEELVELKNPDPSHLSNILRDWQVEFLQSVRIHTAQDLVHAYTHDSKNLAKEMRSWRKQRGLLSVRTRSCKIALRIWSRTCNAVLKAIRENNGQMTGRPDFLDVSLSTDDGTLSTMGLSGPLVGP